MLKRLHINNYALIEQVNVGFPAKLTVVTGETGAGKSIFLEALSLVLGSRADSGTLQDKTKKCIVEAEFYLKNYSMKDFFFENELDYEDTTILRREINPEGKSRAFINDTPVGLIVLKQLGEKLVDIHSQHETLMLNETVFQFDILDSYAGTQILFSQYKTQFVLFNLRKKELNELLAQELQAKKDLDYYQFLFNELEEANLKPGELRELEEEGSTLENAGFIKSNLSGSANLIHDGEINLLSNLTKIKQQLQSLTKFGNSYKSFFERANALYIEAKDLANELEEAETKIIAEPHRLEEINTQLDRINRLLKKHNVKSEYELQIIKSDIENKLSQFGSLENQIEKLKKEISNITAELTKIADELSTKRKASTSKIEKEAEQMLTDLSMPNAHFKIELTVLKELGTAGFDTIKFLFSPNKGSDFKELHKVASGGELSRLMLSLKSLLAAKKSLPTIIFDEIDTGVSGEVANKIGEILLSMGEKMQVISITHLPQIACKGQFHLFVYKHDIKNKTISQIKELNKDERIVEISKMLSTGKPTPSAIKNAEDLLSRN